ncbi:MAG: hypothetical protein A2Y57_03670 [Candidatus Woykebacteria bacterium RBG_13_40_7b]|uniref:RCK N-terminal domain-containing protein n=1 Tax=Candidatus Woykebacteria bacterium RBG_13_40_7b TaxID=1802594 RepID=A0A1G1W6M4_9BACT|nr:MAG: hypothetical protein A2Y57_03670 [Candidatus Woykebacteria bacterium RBG_13_40_7b]
MEGLSQATEEPQIENQITSHVVVCGCGRVGKYVCSALKHVDIPQIVIDFNPVNLKHCENKGIPVIFGDASEEEILKAAMVEEAKALIITYPDQLSASIAIEKAKRLNPNIKILARAHRDIDVEELKSLEIHKVVQPEFEASLTFAHKVLDLMGVEKEEINSFLQHIRRQTPKSV